MVIVGNLVFPCKDGDSLGTEGSIAAHLLAGLPGVAKVHLVFRRSDQTWFAEVPDESGLVVRVDGAVIAPGQKVPLQQDNALQIGEVRLRLHTTVPATAADDGEPSQDEVQDLVSKTTAWLERMLQH